MSENKTGWCTCTLSGGRHTRTDCPYFDPDEPHICGDSASAHDPERPCRCKELQS